jgi:hypothetical protein
VVFLHKDVANDEKIREVYPDQSPAARPTRSEGNS